MPRGVDHIAEAARPRKVAIQIVEGAVLGVDHDDGFDPAAQRLSGRIAGPGVRFEE